MLTKRQVTYITNLIWRDLVHSIESIEQMGLFYIGINNKAETIVIVLANDDNLLQRKTLFAGTYKEALKFLKKYQP